MELLTLLSEPRGHISSLGSLVFFFLIFSYLVCLGEPRNWISPLSLTPLQISFNILLCKFTSQKIKCRRTSRHFWWGLLNHIRVAQTSFQNGGCNTEIKHVLVTSKMYWPLFLPYQSLQGQYLSHINLMWCLLPTWGFHLARPPLTWELVFGKYLSSHVCRILELQWENWYAIKKRLWSGIFLKVSSIIYGSIWNIKCPRLEVGQNILEVP